MTNAYRELVLRCGAAEQLHGVIPPVTHTPQGVVSNYAQFLTAMKSTVFWNVTQCGLVEVHFSFRDLNKLSPNYTESRTYDDSECLFLVSYPGARVRSHVVWHFYGEQSGTGASTAVFTVNSYSISCSRSLIYSPIDVL
jgi:hypothetical protein